MGRGKRQIKKNITWYQFIWKILREIWEYLLEFIFQPFEKRQIGLLWLYLRRRDRPNRVRLDAIIHWFHTIRHKDLGTFYFICEVLFLWSDIFLFYLWYDSILPHHIWQSLAAAQWYCVVSYFVIICVIVLWIRPPMSASDVVWYAICFALAYAIRLI